MDPQNITVRGQSNFGPTQPSVRSSNSPIDILNRLTTIEPQHINACKSLNTPGLEDMRAPSATVLNDIKSPTQSIIARVKIFVSDSLKPLSLNKGKDACQRTISESFQAFVKPGFTSQADCKKYGQELAQILKFSSSTDPVIQKFCIKNPEKVHKYIARAIESCLKIANSAINESVRDANFEPKIQHIIAKFRQRAFLNNVPWNDLTKTVVESHLVDTFVKQSTSKMNPLELRQLIKDAIDELDEVQASPADVGSKLKANKKTPEAIIQLTQIRAASGKVYELINTPTPEQLASIKAKIGFTVDTGTLGTGGFGKVRYALDTETQEIVAVKKMDTRIKSDGTWKHSRRDAEQEINTFRQISDGQFTVKLHDYAHLTNANNDNKSYLFMDLAADFDGAKAIPKIHTVLATNNTNLSQLINTVSREYTRSVAELHSQGNYHRDIKPANFLHKNILNIKIGDYGLVTQDNNRPFTGGTKGYMVPERNTSSYTAEKHDSFSLGMTLLALKNNCLGFQQYQNSNQPFHLLLNQQPVSLDFQGRNCLGLTNSHQLQGRTLDEVIGKLLDKDPTQRISPRDALKLPFFNTNAAAQFLK